MQLFAVIIIEINFHFGLRTPGSFMFCLYLRDLNKIWVTLRPARLEVRTTFAQYSNPFFFLFTLNPC